MTEPASLAGGVAWPMMKRLLVGIALTVAAAGPLGAAGFQVLTVDKVAHFVNRGDPVENEGSVTVGADRALATLFDPRCPQTSKVEVEAYLQSTYRDAILASVVLDCAKWAAADGGFAYADPAGTVRSVSYTSEGLRIDVKGPGLVPIAGPVGFLQAQLAVGDEWLRARFHNFEENDGSVVSSRKPSAAAAAGEAGFWDVILGDDSSEKRERETLRILRKAARRDRKDGRSRFLIAMLRFYRFGQRTTDFAEASKTAKAELRKGNVWFAKATPLLWDDATGTGDSRVPGFAAAGKYLQGVLEGKARLRDAGLADLERAVEVNAFFNVFDYIPVIQATPPTDPLFELAFTKVTTYLNDPETLACVVTQPEICSNAGFAPHNIQGSLTLFGDIYAKHGDVTPARNWYTIAASFPGAETWPFKSALDDRLANVTARAALYQDGDPSNDPPIIGAGPEACTSCHIR